MLRKHDATKTAALQRLMNRQSYFSAEEDKTAMKLVREDADPNCKDNEGNTLLHRLATTDDDGVIKELIEHKADIHQRNNNGWTPLQKLLSFKLLPAAHCMRLVRHGALSTEANKEGDTLLHKLAKEEYSHALIVELVTSRGANILQENKEQLTPLQAAMNVYPFYPATAMVLVGLKANLEDRDSYGNTLLHRLVKIKEYPRVTELATKYKVNIHQKNKKLETPLQWMMNNNNFSADDAMILVRLGANPNDKDEYGDTLLHRVIKMERYDLAEELVTQRGATHQSGQHNYTPLQWVMRRDPLPLETAMKLVRLKANLKDRDKDGNTLLHRLPMNEANINAVFKELINEHKADIEQLNQNGWTPLQHLMNNSLYVDGEGCMKFVRFGAKPNQVDSRGHTLLHRLVIRSEYNALVTELVTQWKAEIRQGIKDKDGWTPLQLLMNYMPSKANSLEKMFNTFPFSIETALNLVRLGANPQDTDKKGESLLHRLVTRKDVADAVIEELVTKRQADIHHISNGCTPLKKLLARQQLAPEEVARAMTLVHLKANPLETDHKDRPLLHRIVRANTKRDSDAHIDDLLNKFKVDINLKDKKRGRTALLFLMRSQKMKGADKIAFIEWLISKGADLNAIDKKNKTALHHATRSDDVVLVEWLLKQKNIDINARDASGATPLFYACYYGQLALAQCLVKAGANPTDKNNKGQTLLHAAVMSNNLDMVTWLTGLGKVDITAIDNDDKTALNVNAQLWDPLKKHLQPFFPAAAPPGATQKPGSGATTTKTGPGATTNTTTTGKNSPPTSPPPQTTGDKKLDTFIQMHALSLEHSGFFRAIKRFFSSMRDLLFKDPKKPIKTFKDVEAYAKRHTSTRTAHIIKMMNSKMSIEEFKKGYEDARKKQWFNNPFETTMRDTLKALDTPAKVGAFKMETIIDHAIKKPDSLTAEVITRYAMGA